MVKGPAGTTDLTARFAGDATHDPSSATQKFTVTKRASDISFTATSGKKGTVVVSVSLVDAETRDGLAGRAVNVFVNGKKMATATTDSEGRAKATFKLSKPKGKTFRAAFASDGTHPGSAAQGTFGKKGASGSS